MNIILTGGAGFIGRWVAKQLLEDGHSVWIVDDLSNGREDNLEEFRGHTGLKAFIRAIGLNIPNSPLISRAFFGKIPLIA